VSKSAQCKANSLTSLSNNRMPLLSVLSTSRAEYDQRRITKKVANDGQRAASEPHSSSRREAQELQNEGPYRLNGSVDHPSFLKCFQTVDGLGK